MSLQVDAGERIGIVGPNGAGKSTLLHLLLGRREPEQGRASLGANVAIGEIDQARARLDRAGTLAEVFAGELPDWPDAEVRTLLAKFGLGAEHIGRQCDTLSMGERTRAELAVLQGRAVNVVVLDEPTNHADVEAIEQLQSALESFGGTVLLVTHDRALADAVHPAITWRFTRVGDRANVEVSRRS